MLSVFYLVNPPPPPSRTNFTHSTNFYCGSLWTPPNVADWYHTFWCRLKMLPLSSLRSTTPTTSRHCSCSLLHPLWWNTYAASTAVDIYICNIYCCLWTIYAASIAVEYICNIHCCGICLLHPLLWNTYAASTAMDIYICNIYAAVEYICNIHCCIHCYGIYMLHPLWWNSGYATSTAVDIWAASTAVDYSSAHHHFRGVLHCPWPWTCARLPLLWIRAASHTCHW